MSTIKTQKEKYSETFQEYLKYKKENPNCIISQKFYYYLAYVNLWKFINRHNLTDEDIRIMKELNIYKYSRKELGIPREPSKNRIYLDKAIYYVPKRDKILDFSHTVKSIKI